MPIQYVKLFKIHQKLLNNQLNNMIFRKMLINIKEIYQSKKKQPYLVIMFCIYKNRTTTLESKMILKRFYKP